MHVFLGNLLMEGGDYERGIQSFEDARVKLGNYTHPPPLIVSLVYLPPSYIVLKLILILTDFWMGV